MKISMLINMKKPTVVGIFIFISRENFILSWVEHEKSFITSGPDLSVYAPRQLKFYFSVETYALISLRIISPQYFLLTPQYFPHHSISFSSDTTISYFLTRMVYFSQHYIVFSLPPYLPYHNTIGLLHWYWWILSWVGISRTRVCEHP